MAMDRIDLHPTDEHEGYKLRPGRAFPFGATFVPGGVNFSVFSRHAIACTLVLFEKGAKQPKVEIPFPDAYRIGNVYSMIVFDLDFDEMNHINYDWYAPANAARQTPEEVRAWCAESGLSIEREVIEEAGITVIARKGAG